VTAVAVVLAGAAACGDDDDSSGGTTSTTESPGTGSSVLQSAQQLCDDLEGLDSTVQNLEVDPDTTTISDIKDDLDQLRSEVSDVAGSGSALATALGAALQAAFDRFESEVQNLPDDQTLQAAGDAARSAGDEFKQSWDDAMAALDCNRGS
jgi:hypothetical protein